MSKIKIVSVILFFVIGVTPSWCQTLSDVDKEQRWSEQVIDTLFDGEPVWLKAANHEFLGIEMVPDNQNEKLGAIIVHGIGVHPNWQQVILPLRVGMAEEGWHTLSIQMPVLENNAEAKQYAPLFNEVPLRINAAIAHLKSQDISNIILIAHSMGSAMSVSYLSVKPENPIKAAVLIGLNADTEAMPIEVAAALRSIKIPILDIYGEQDLEQVVKSAPRRANALFLAGHPANSQVKMAGADHFFEGQEEPLVEVVLDWVNGFH